VRVGDAVASPVNVAAGKARLTRTIAGWVPNFGAVAAVLARSDLLATLPALALKDAAGADKLWSREVPFPIPALPHALVWCSGRGRDPGPKWLLDRLRPIVKRCLTV
jgi:DNA-binding transcriptional LysR family regulator